jgi:hypothetical protein
MSRIHLLAAAKSKLGAKNDIEFGKALGCVKSFISMMRCGQKNIPATVFDKIEAAGIPKEEIDRLMGLNDDDGSEPVQPVPVVQRHAPHEEPVLPSAVSGGDAEAAPATALRVEGEGAGEGSGQRPDVAGQPGAEAEADVPGAAKTARRKRNDLSSIVLREGSIYYPKKDSKHTHRRITGLTRNGKASYVLYSIGSDTIHCCERRTFLAWMDLAKIDKPQPSAGSLT